jgi:hypothetical protein
MGKINVRSPYYVHIEEQYLTFAKLELYVYTGTQTTDRGSVKYTIEGVAGLDNKITFEISELVKDYIETTFDGSYTSSSVWVDYQITRTLQGAIQPADAFVQLTGFDGYGYFSEGANPQNDSVVLQSNSFIQTNDYANINIPVHVTESTDVTYFKNGEIILQKTLSSSSESTDAIQYVSSSSLDSDAFYTRVIADGGYIEAFSCVQEIANDFYANLDADKIQVSNMSGTQIITVQEIEECLHQTYKLTFVNKYGALQDVWFFKRSTLSMGTTQETYKSNIVTDGSYSINRHQKRILNKQGNESLTLNSGFYAEEYNEVFKQLLLSEQVWINYENNILPVNITSSALTFKDQLNDKLISYEINVEFSNDIINNIR